MNILVFFPYNLRTVEQQSVLKMLLSQGHNVFLLTTCSKGFLHSFAESLGIPAEGINVDQSISKLRFYFENFKRLKRTIRKYKIDVVIAHQQVPALIAGIVRKRIPFKLLYVRHNSDEDYQLAPFKAKWLNKLANLVTPIKVAPSTVVQNFWAVQEGVPSAQIKRVNYGYDFEQYEKANPDEVQKIKAQFPCALRILSIARLSATKRHMQMFEVVTTLLKQGIDCTLLCLGTGPDEQALRQQLREKNLESQVFLLGRRENIFDYIEAADVFVHLSNSEASNSAVKEVGLLEKPVVVCKGVGDFDDYIVNGQNGFLVDKENPLKQTIEILEALANKSVDGNKIGRQLRKTVVNKFHIDNIKQQYEDILKHAR